MRSVFYHNQQHVTLHRPQLLIASGVLIAQLFGATLLGFGVLNRSARNRGEGTQAVLTANLAADAIGFIFSLIGQHPYARS